MDALLLEDVTKTFGAVRAVDCLSARVPAGSIYGFLGPNGAGKTTTIRMIMKIIHPDSGRIEILGRPSEEIARERIGYMPEERGLYRKMKARAALSFIGAIKGVGYSRLNRTLPQWFERVGLTDWADRKVEELSRGMQQKLQFIATIINDPDILILDEPFSGLDPVNLDLLKDILLEMREKGRTVIFSTHVMEQAERLCDSILLINKGAKVVDGRLEEIRSGYESNAVSVELEGDTGFVDDLPMVETTKRNGKKVEIFLRPGSDNQALLRALVERARVLSFEEKLPSLHEIFVRLVGHNDE